MLEILIFCVKVGRKPALNLKITDLNLERYLEVLN